MTVADMVDRIKVRTFQKDDTKVIGELRAAVDWAFNRIFDTENGADLIATWGSELTMAAQTREYNLAANVSGTIYGIKALWLRFSTETTFTPMRPVDSADMRFLFDDQYASSDTTTVAVGHPVLYDVVQFGKLRFAPPLPSGSVLRVDYWKKPAIVDPTTNNTLDLGTDLPPVVDESIIDKATGQIFDLMDDTRAEKWEKRAEARLTDALYVIVRRTSGPTETQPFRIRRRRLF